MRPAAASLRGSRCRGEPAELWLTPPASGRVAALRNCHSLSPTRVRRGAGRRPREGGVTHGGDAFAEASFLAVGSPVTMPTKAKAHSGIGRGAGRRPQRASRGRAQRAAARQCARAARQCAPGGGRGHGIACQRARRGVWADPINTIVRSGPCRRAARPVAAWRGPHLLGGGRRHQWQKQAPALAAPPGRRAPVLAGALGVKGLEGPPARQAPWQALLGRGQPAGRRGRPARGSRARRALPARPIKRGTRQGAQGVCSRGAAQTPPMCSDSYVLSTPGGGGRGGGAAGLRSPAPASRRTGALAGRPRCAWVKGRERGGGNGRGRRRGRLPAYQERGTIAFVSCVVESSRGSGPGGRQGPRGPPQRAAPRPDRPDLPDHPR
ncbi:MAG: hypothetical protein J3K34DRAFT_114165 [Monoraphidium minutum]|nr:MAG: hypothetical protein J3K34DRAFT_114165 [Monoraphidium minutum]